MPREQFEVSSHLACFVTPPAFDRGEASRLLVAGLRDAGYETETVSGLLAAHPAVRTLWSE